MDDAFSFAITRERTKWDDLIYECRECDATAGAIAAITHTGDCQFETGGGASRARTSTQNLSDEEPSVFHESTWEVIRRAERESGFLLQEQDADTDGLVEGLSDVDGVRWVVTGSTHRVILGLGRTSPRGAFHREDHRGVVLKVDPRIRFDKEYTPVSSNIDELFTWEKAVETGTEKFFADIFAAPADGMWLAMEYCIPIHKRIRGEMGSRDMLFDSGGEEYINPLRGALLEAGWEDPDYKHGNIGLTDQGIPVCIDYGTGPDYVGAESVE